ncbi:hypothetical protein [Aurantiacibacter spongiae]|uniref:Uncharacterized protein n=1 Tax=Aurantiacibacter spongiae TaxID=2488860 RepID=A0A3N5DIA9_9SPHN|nr:hypothetical protein [Aurantiacibacter spongiae]RPF70365.1 hypothetical protein EG799_00995 [Aurantiacibacter spongiae]
MNDSVSDTLPTRSVEDVLRAELAQGDVIIATARPILRHLLANDDQAMFSDEVIARIRGMMLDLARQLLFALARQADMRDPAAFAVEREDDLAVALLEETGLLTHSHALTIEARLADKLNARGIDPVLSPLLQELAASSDQAEAAAAMRVLAAQARFVQHQRRMELPFGELPGELFHAAIETLVSQAGAFQQDARAVAASLRSEYDESERRVNQINRLLMKLQHRAKRALAIGNSGLAIFATALAMGSEQERDTVILSLGENQFARLALSLRASGLDQGDVEEQFVYLHPELSLPAGFDTLRADKAAELLASSSPEALH